MGRSATLPSGLTIKQTRFAYEFVRNGGKASDAYRHAYNADSMKVQTISRESQVLLKNHKIATLIESIQSDSQKALGATIEWKKTKLMQIAEYGLSEEVTGDDEEDVQLRQVNPSSTVSAIKELNAMDGHHAAIKAKLDIGVKVEVNASQLAIQSGFSKAEVEQALTYQLDHGMKDIDAVNKVLSEREKVDAIEGELVDDPWSEE